MDAMRLGEILFDCNTWSTSSPGMYQSHTKIALSKDVFATLHISTLVRSSGICRSLLPNPNRVWLSFHFFFLPFVFNQHGEKEKSWWTEVICQNTACTAESHVWLHGSSKALRQFRYIQVSALLLLKKQKKLHHGHIESNVAHLRLVPGIVGNASWSAKALHPVATSISHTNRNMASHRIFLCEIKRPESGSHGIIPRGAVASSCHRQAFAVWLWSKLAQNMVVLSLDHVIAWVWVWVWVLTVSGRSFFYGFVRFFFQASGYRLDLSASASCAYFLSWTGVCHGDDLLPLNDGMPRALGVPRTLTLDQYVWSTQNVSLVLKQCVMFMWHARSQCTRASAQIHAMFVKTVHTLMICIYFHHKIGVDSALVAFFAWWHLRLWCHGQTDTKKGIGVASAGSVRRHTASVPWALISVTRSSSHHRVIIESSSSHHRVIKPFRASSFHSDTVP
jgi:hypothetical protein